MAQQFEHGRIYWSPKTGAWAVTGAVQDHWRDLGWENGQAGYPVGDETKTANGVYQLFQHGTMYWTQKTGAHYVHDGIFVAYRNHGFEHGQLGFPTTDERKINGGTTQSFEHGEIHWTQRTGAHATTGAIRDYWAASGWENGWLGYPIGDELTRLRDGGASQTFQYGIVFWSPATGAHATSGGINDQYAAQRWEGGNLGYPTSDEYDSGQGRAQNFQHGTLHWYGCGKKGWQNPGQYFQVSSCNVSVPNRSIFGYASPSRIGMSATREQAIEAMISRAYDYLGTRYVWDYALQPGVGVDCAGLVMQSLYATGMDLKEYNPTNHWYDPWHSHDANNMAADSRFKHVSLAERQRGDLIFWPGHVAIYLGNDQIIEANVPSVRLNNMWNNGSPTAVARPFV
ncbi:NlpC/P60 family protein [Bifidobacterium avesanii]|nr:NlpC/P60 family protein [Bifidobacterium avesanii]KAB8291915.1 LGFP repeat-containing protein [Bifidobacterium avesanii]